MHMTGNNNPKDSKSFLFQGRPSQVLGETSAPTSATAKVYSVGDVGPGGGVVFYVHPSGTFTSIGSEGGLNCKYLEAAPADLKGKFRWCSDTESLLGVTATGIGSGMANTTTAANKCPRRWRRRRDSSSAIHSAANYVNNGKTDWHLPSRDELNELYKYAYLLSSLAIGDVFSLLPGFTAASSRSFIYWSSTESSAPYAWVQHLGGHGSTSGAPKPNMFRVRPVRAF
jgi:hypothetical protein